MLLDAPGYSLQWNISVFLGTNGSNWTEHVTLGFHNPHLSLVKWLMHCACSKILIIDVFSLVWYFSIQHSRIDQLSHARRILEKKICDLLCTEISLQWLMETLKTLSCNCTVLEESSLVVSFWKLDSNLPYTLIWEWWSLIPNLWWAPHSRHSSDSHHSRWWVLAHTLFCYPASYVLVFISYLFISDSKSQQGATLIIHIINTEELRGSLDVSHSRPGGLSTTMTGAGLSYFFCSRKEKDVGFFQSSRRASQIC